MKPKSVHAALFGLAIGDALGVPVEFKKREELKNRKVKDFEGYQTHNQPPGTFSDDSSLTFCLAESLCHGYDLHDMGQRFVKWFFEGYWTAGGEVFGVGKSTEDSITRLRDGVSPLQSGNYADDCYGNGSRPVGGCNEFVIKPRFDYAQRVKHNPSTALRVLKIML